MKYTAKKIASRKPSENDFARVKTRPLPEWMRDPKLLPKDPPHRMKSTTEPKEAPK